jgi:hypothetical protein
MLLDALVACAGVTLKAASTVEPITPRRGRLLAWCAIVARNEPRGLATLRLSFPARRAIVGPRFPVIASRLRAL